MKTIISCSYSIRKHLLTYILVKVKKDIMVFKKMVKNILED